MTDHRLSKAQREKLEAKRRAARNSMRCRGVRIEVVGRDAISTHPGARRPSFGWAQRERQDRLLRLRREVVPQWQRRRTTHHLPADAAYGTIDCWALAICAECAKRADLRAAIAAWLLKPPCITRGFSTTTSRVSSCRNSMGRAAS